MDYTAVLYAVGVLAVIGCIFGAVLSAAGKKLAVKEDKRIGELKELLGGANCGACGYAGCEAFAKAVLAGEAKPGACTVMSEENSVRAGELLGVSVEKREPMAAKVLCQGISGVAKEKYIYEGVRSCRVAASLAGGPKLCEYACLGLGDCGGVCAFQAISISSGVAVIDAGLCKGCGECAQVCPRGAIRLIPRSQTVNVLCRNEKNAREAKKECTRACIGCGRCKRECEAGAIEIVNGVAGIDAEKCTRCGKCAGVCPCGCIEAVLKA